MSSLRAGTTGTSLSVLPTVILALPNRAALAQRLLDDAPGGLFVPGPSSLSAGQVVCVDVAVARELLSLQGVGEVRWRRVSSSPCLSAGIGIRLREPGFALLLKRLASDSSMRIVPRARRYYAAVDTHCFGAHRLVIGQTRDVSRTGLFVRAARPFDVGSTVQVRLLPPDTKPFLVSARVTRVERDGMGLCLGPLDVLARDGWQQLQRALQMRSIS